MKAKVISVGKEILPRYSQESGQDEPTLQVVVEVEFFNDDGSVYEPHPKQTYALLPEQAHTGYFQNQADAMQADLDQAAGNAVFAQQSLLVDAKVEELKVLIEPTNEISKE